MNAKILVVENDPDILQIISHVLADEGYKPIPCQNEYGIFDVISEQKPDAILLDVIRPTEQGTVLCREIKAAETTKHIPVIVLSTHAEIETVKEICADEVVKKPFDIDYLLAIIKEQLTDDFSVAS
ncbi:MAG TPA: response regulator [Daejeonella sp.]|nr:response regulator [Daejeonella sp.]